MTSRVNSGMGAIAELNASAWDPSPGSRQVELEIAETVLDPVGPAGTVLEPPEDPPSAETVVVLTPDLGETVLDPVGEPVPANRDEPQTRSIPLRATRSSAAPRPSSGRAPVHLPELGERVGPYELHELLGQGGMGAVYRATHVELRRTVALKVMLGGPRGSDASEDAQGLRQRFMAEARAAARLEHSAIVAIHDVGEDGQRAYMALELIEGPSLDRLLRDGGPLSSIRAATWLKTLAGAVQAAHAQKILHRDLKPANVLVGPEGPVLTDFGLAKQLESEEQSLTLSGTVLGTPAYMAPEQAQGRPADARTDVYGLGAVLYEALTGVAPFKAATPLLTLRAVVHERPRRPRRLVRAISPKLERICLRCLHKDPARRYRSASALADDLERFLKGQQIEASPWRKLREQRPVRLVAGLALAAVLGLAGLSGLWSSPSALSALGEGGQLSRHELAARSAEARARLGAALDRAPLQGVEAPEFDPLEHWQGIRKHCQSALAQPEARLDPALRETLERAQALAELEIDAETRMGRAQKLLLLARGDDGWLDHERGAVLEARFELSQIDPTADCAREARELLSEIRVASKRGEVERAFDHGRADRALELLDDLASQPALRSDELAWIEEFRALVEEVQHCHAFAIEAWGFGDVAAARAALERLLDLTSPRSSNVYRWRAEQFVKTKLMPPRSRSTVIEVMIQVRRHRFVAARDTLERFVSDTPLSDVEQGDLREVLAIEANRLLTQASAAGAPSAELRAGLELLVAWGRPETAAAAAGLLKPEAE